MDELGIPILGSKYVTNPIGMRTRTRISYVLLLDAKRLELNIGTRLARIVYSVIPGHS